MSQDARARDMGQTTKKQREGAAPRKTGRRFLRGIAKVETGMTFSAQVKNELSAHIPEKACCARAFCCGAACFSHAFCAEKLEFHTESRTVARCLVDAFAAQDITLTAGNCSAHGRSKLSLHAGGNAALAELAKSAAAPDALLRCPGCGGAWLSGAFLCCGVVANPQKEYHMEFISQQPQRLQQLAGLLEREGYIPRLTKKNANQVLYLRASGQIEDVLTRMGAPHCAMALMNEKIYKDLRNQVNRVTNCENANIDKTVAANQRTLQALRLLEQNGALGSLPPPLAAAANARLADPTATLAELAAAMQPPVSKSGLAHRLRKLEQLAEDWKQKQAAKTPK